MGEKPFLDRRGFFKKLMGPGAPSRTFFAVQVVFDAAGQEELRARIQAVLDAPGEETLEEKRRLYRRLTSALLEAEPFYEYAYFEYITDPEKAADSFEQWVLEIEAAFASEEEEVGDDVDGYHRMAASQRYIVVSMLFLADSPHPFHGEELDTEELYTRAGVGKLVDSVNRYNFNRVQADAAYLVPGSPDDGFSWADFADEGWAYLVSLPY